MATAALVSLWLIKIKNYSNKFKAQCLFYLTKALYIKASSLSD